jgi:hypothetical protein
MATTFSSIELPNYVQKPFFSSIFCCSIAIGSTFIFKRSSDHLKKSLVVGQIIDATKVGEDDHEVTVNVFLSFDDWPPNKTLYPIKEGLGKNLQEVVLTSERDTYIFDRDVYDIAFVFSTFELNKRGAILQGIDNVFVCRYYDDEEEVKDGAIVPFPSMIKAKCPVPRCFLSWVFFRYRNSPLPNVLRPQSKW